MRMVRAPASAARLGRRGRGHMHPGIAKCDAIAIDTIAPLSAKPLIRLTIVLI